MQNDQDATKMDIEKGAVAPIAAGEPHSIYTKNQKRMMVVAAAVASTFSPITGNIYLPALNSVAHDLKVSNSVVTLTVTFYMILQGIAPTFIGAFSDSAGRRPAYIICFVVFIAANIGLALQNNYVALLVLRMVQSSGSSGTVALANACVADLVTSAERGSYIAYTSLSSILAPALGPVIGGILSQYAGWHWIFGFLAIAAATFFVPFFLFFPETCRVIVGNGSIPPPRLNQSLPTYLLEKQKRREGDIAVFIKRDQLAKDRKISFPNPMDTLRIVFSKTAGLILLSTSLLFSTAYAVMTSIPSQFSKRYGFDDLQVSLIYLPLAVGSTLSAFTTGKLIDRNYRRHAKKLGLTIDRNRQDDLTDFPIERSRIEVSMPIAMVGVVAVIGYGWMVESNISLAGPCIMLFIFGYSMTAMFNTMNILMVDIYQGRPASATAANNLTRCLLGAGATAAVIPLTESIGIGWTCTLAAGLWGGFSLPLLVFLMKVGPRWRKEAKARKDARAEKKAATVKTQDEQIKASDILEKDISTPAKLPVQEDEIALGEKRPGKGDSMNAKKQVELGIKTENRRLAL